MLFYRPLGLEDRSSSEDLLQLRDSMRLLIPCHSLVMFEDGLPTQRVTAA